ncbi:MAG TPA: SDR family NAD(P)-dependent oxidoreductase [Candidatus Acidoferrales bacterium]|nr:SDR family NAD(P)-dependent oxidoreductase [Candidatus Acidoferrales bacterium]
MNPAKPLAGQVALVTGSSRGIGLAIARTFGTMGAKVGLCARNADSLERAESELRNAGCQTLAEAADVSDAAQVTSLVQWVNEALGEIDILVNNAGIGLFAPLHELSEEDWDRVMNTNLKGVYLCSRAVAPQMVRRRGGHIINISSLAGKNAFAKGGVYCASKWGLQGLTACQAEDLRGYGIRVSAVCPGTVQTEFSPHAGKDTEKMLQPEDVAHVVAMLVTQAPQSFVSEVALRPTQKP